MKIRRVGRSVNGEGRKEFASRHNFPKLKDENLKSGGGEMGRAPKSAGPNPSDGNPEAAERRRLKRLALARGALSEAPARCGAPLGPSKTALKHHGKDIVKRSQRKNRFLFSFPGLLAPIGGGKVGELKDLGTKNPVLYLDFPQVWRFPVPLFRFPYGSVPACRGSDSFDSSVVLTIYAVRSLIEMARDEAKLGTEESRLDREWGVDSFLDRTLYV